MYHFIFRLHGKVAGTEMGIIAAKKLTFSACFGAAFLPLHHKPTPLLAKRWEKYETNVWLINNSWTGGPYGLDLELKLSYTGDDLCQALEGNLDGCVEFKQHPVFGFQVPQFLPKCSYLTGDFLNPRAYLPNSENYDRQAKELANSFLLRN